MVAVAVGERVELPDGTVLTLAESRGGSVAFRIEAPGGEPAAYCYDCGRRYGDEYGFPDLVIPNYPWEQISPTGDSGGLLCPSCICARLAKAGIQCEGSFMSGPIECVSRPLMHALGWIENLREQGHGWSCPKCGPWRERVTCP